MRKNTNSKISVNYIAIYILALLLFVNSVTFFTEDVSAEEFQLYIDVEQEVFEGDTINISVCTYDVLVGLQCYDDVEINFDKILLENPYEIPAGDTDKEITLLIPEVNEDTDVTITASKSGYISTTEVITVKNKVTALPNLQIETDIGTVDAGNRFRVLVYDDNDAPVSQVLVAIQNFGESDYTDDDGRVWLTAPEDWDYDTITIIASKEGYDTDREVIGLNIELSLIDRILQNPYTIMILGGSILLIAILFVYFRQKISITNRAKEISKQQTKKEYDKDLSTRESKEEIITASSLKSGVRVGPRSDPKVEEIRISRPRPEKEVVSVDSVEDETDKLIEKKKMQKKDQEWFEGTDEIRYEIDKLTGEIDEDGVDKWYEGKDNIKEKIDERVKKKDKKKDEEDSNYSY